jgi:hypothetical protein
VVSELVTNAVAHALPPVVLHLTLTTGGTGVQVRVTDGGPAPTTAAWAAQPPSENTAAAPGSSTTGPASAPPDAARAHPPGVAGLLRSASPGRPHSRP